MSNKSFSQSQFNILLVDDENDDIILTKHVFGTLPIPIEFQIAHDGLEALELLRGERPRGNASLPDLILLDLNMPRMDGRQLLRELKSDDPLRLIPVVILSTSDADTDVCDAYRNHASAYMTKPIDLQEFSSRIKHFADFWLNDVIVMPTRSNVRHADSCFAATSTSHAGC